MNRKMYIRIFLLILLYLVILSALRAQTVKDQFELAKQEHVQDYNKFVEQKDKEFADFLRRNWRSFSVYDSDAPKPKPKPTEFPALHKIVPDPLELPRPDTLQRLDIQEELVMPVDHKTAIYSGSIQTTSFVFFGDTIQVKYDRLEVGRMDVISPQNIGDYWEKISQSNYRVVLDELLAYKQKYVLNDFGYYLLVRELSHVIFDSDNQKKLFTWFILSKSKYKSKIGYNLNQVFLLLPSTRNVYGKRYFVQDEVKYYLMDYGGGEIYAYEDHYPGAFRTMDFTIKDGLKLRQKTKTSSLNFSDKGEEYELKFSYNQNAIDFYNKVPAIDLSGYFEAQLSQSARESLIESLSPIVSQMDEVEAVGFLLSLVQKGFDYQIDEEQFGKEKVFFPEEILHYPYSDCEDRSVFFAYLVSTLVGNAVIGLDYPAHVATAVHFQTDVGGDYFMFEGKKYVVCDPTYVNAPIGVSMRDLTQYSAEIIQRENAQPSLPALEKLKAILGIRGDLSSPKVLKVQEGNILASHYSREVWVQNEHLSTPGSGLLLTGFDKNDNYQWSKSVPLETEDGFKGIASDKEGNIILLSKIEPKSYALRKLDKSGMSLWVKTIHVPEPVVKKANVQATLFDGAGNLLAGKSYMETEYYESKPLAVVKDNILVILPIDDE